ncbi:hypothetical protein [Salinigranum marinum]|uniref:hypothetical protein n=1 Tax=Salinigranum marinum TaxID=1515595 RepID=UPI002989FA6B|nr:hypothetical protein [Salinigranum marinum]
MSRSEQSDARSPCTIPTSSARVSHTRDRHHRGLHPGRDARRRAASVGGRIPWTTRTVVRE